MIKFNIKCAPACIAVFAAMLLFACHAKSTDDGGGDDKVSTQTPVTVTGVGDSSMVEYTTLNATSSFLQKNFVKSNTIGYVQKVYVVQGQYVERGQLLFTLKTKEAQAIGNSINVLDTTFKFSGVNGIRASKHGYITELSHQAGDYVQDGEQLAIISDRGSFAFVMQLPYEMRSTVNLNESILLTLPNGEKITGHITSFMPSVDTVAQTQGAVIAIGESKAIPENLVAKARVVRASKPNAQSLPKSAILSNETQTEFWVMKLINQTTAVKVPVTKGIEIGDRVEILSPKFASTDRIVASGNYGLADTAKINIVKQ